jgi:hypothetical protein
METMLRVVEEIARLDGAVGWNVMIGAESGAFFAYLPTEFASEVFRDAPDSLMAGTSQPNGDRGARGHRRLRAGPPRLLHSQSSRITHARQATGRRQAWA